MYITEIFTEILGEYSLEQHKDKNEYFYEKVKELELKYSNESSWKRCDTFSTMKFYNLKEDKVFLEILPDIEKLLILFAEQYGAVNVKPKMTDGWINLTHPGDYQEYHVHPNNHISVVYYVKVPENCGNLVFRSHCADKDMFLLPVSVLTRFSFKTWSVKPLENQIVFFRSNLSHMVEKNRSLDDRVSISLNFLLE
jgi:uncharacterized protein (TIGR02466 family)